MSAIRYVPCGACQRHVRASEVGCPFCGAAVVVTKDEAEMPVGRLGRAALFAFATSVAAACTPSHPTNATPDTGEYNPPPTPPAPAPPRDDPGMAAIYGGPPPMPTPVPAPEPSNHPAKPPTPTPNPHPIQVPAYGGPPPTPPMPPRPNPGGMGMTRYGAPPPPNADDWV